MRWGLCAITRLQVRGSSSGRFLRKPAARCGGHGRNRNDLPVAVGTGLGSRPADWVADLPSLGTRSALIACHGWTLAPVHPLPDLAYLPQRQVRGLDTTPQIPRQHWPASRPVQTGADWTKATRCDWTEAGDLGSLPHTNPCRESLAVAINQAVIDRPSGVCGMLRGSLPSGGLWVILCPGSLLASA